MNRIIARMTTAAIALVAALGLTGCDVFPPIPCCGGGTDQVALVVGVRGNSAAVTAELVRRALDPVDADGDRITVVSVEGIPRAVFDFPLEDVPSNSYDREDYLARLEALVLQAVQAAAAQTPEADVVEAIELAALAVSEGTGTRRIVVLDSMLSTTGALSMLDGRIYDDPADRVAALGDAGAIPQLAGVQVELPRLGVVTEPQAALTAEAWSSLAAQWEAFFAAAGAEARFGTEALVAQPQQVDGLPEVTPVPVDRPQPVTASCRSLLPDAAIGFVADRADFLDPSAARAALARIAEQLRGCEGGILVEGSTSSARGEDVNGPLSEARARAVAEPLAAELGIAADGIEIVGWGSSWPCRAADRDGSGRLVEAAAAQNRVVVVSRGVEPGRC